MTVKICYKENDHDIATAVQIYLDNLIDDTPMLSYVRVRLFER